MMTSLVCSQCGKPLESTFCPYCMAPGISRTLSTNSPGVPPSVIGKLALVPLLLIAACLIAGLYGALHNQISYTVSPDYFHTFKFKQFRIPEHQHGRVGAAIVGWYASWWMGLFIGIPVLLVGLILPGWKLYLSRCLLTFAVVACTALIVGLGALQYAKFTFAEGSLPWYAIRGEISDRVAFAQAGTMHNFSYLGGFIGIITGSLYLIAERLRINRSARSAVHS